jgi:hypothetical protein
MELGGKGKNGAMALLELWRDVHDEGRTDMSEGGGVEDLEGAMGLAVDGQLLEPGEEATFVAERRGVIVVGVTGFPIGEDDGFGAKLTDDGWVGRRSRERRECRASSREESWQTWQLPWRAFPACHGCPFRRR